MNRLVFTHAVGQEFRASMLASKLETAGFVLAEPVRLDSGWRLIVQKTVISPDDAYEQRTEHRIVLRPGFLAQIYKTARHNKLSVFFAHTHPWDGPAAASAVDLSGEEISLPRLFARVPEVPHGRLIISNTDYECVVFPELGASEPARVWTLGPKIEEFPKLRRSEISSGENQGSSSRHDRQIRAFGANGQQRLETIAVAIVGLGGTVSLVAQQLSYLGIRTFQLFDPDIVDTSNLNRIVGALPTDINQYKTDVARRLISSVNPSASVVSRRESVLLNSVARDLAQSDVVFCCTDSHGSRAVLTQLAYQYFIPMFDMGVRVDVNDEGADAFGRAQMIGPGLPCLICTGILDPSVVRRDLMSDYERQLDPYITGASVPHPAVITLNSVAASLATTMFLAAVTDLDFSARLQLYRAHTGVVRSIRSINDPECVVCSSFGALGRGDKWRLPGRSAA